MKGLKERQEKMNKLQDELIRRNKKGLVLSGVSGVLMLGAMLALLLAHLDLVDLIELLTK